MRRIVVSEFVSLDGVMQAPGAPEEDTSGGFKHGGWIFKFRDDRDPKYKLDELCASGALLLGRVSYEIFAGYWPNANVPGFANKMNSMAKHVVSTTLKKLDWNNSTLIKTNVPEEVRKLKQQPGKDILVYGSAKLVSTLLQHDLVDELRLMVYPIVLGSGKPLFDKAESMKMLKLADSKIFPSGIVLLSYHRAK